VEFRLLYEGRLRPSGNTRRGSETHAIRQAFHPQLRRLWDLNSNLRFLAEHKSIELISTSDPQPTTKEERIELGYKAMGDTWSRCGYNFIPLVTEKMDLRCGLDILLLRPEEEKYLFTQGDIDGQLKTLFDALRLPKTSEEIGGITPQEAETPFFCLLEDDRLISEVRVTADQLLLLPREKEVQANDAFVLIHVKINHRHARTFDNYFG
jgi:hypothetical protein